MVLTDDDARPLGQGRAEGGTEPRAELGGELDVDESAQSVGREQPASPLTRPDHRLVDGRARLDGLARPDLDAGTDLRSPSEHALVRDDRVLLEQRVILDGDVAADDRLAQPAALTDVRVWPHDAVADLGVVVDDAVPVDDAVLVDVRAGLELHLVADERRAVELDADADLDTLAHPDVALTATRDVAADLAVERVPVRLHVRLDGTDVAPVILDHDAVQRFVTPEHRREDVLRPVGVRALLDVFEHLRLDHVDARVGVIAEHLTPRRLLQETLDVSLVVRHDDPVLEGIGDGVEHDGGVRPALLVCAHHRGEIDVGEGVAADHQEGVIEEVGGVAHTPRGPERPVLDDVLDLHVQLGAVSKAIADLLAEVGERHDDLGDPVIPEEPEDVLEHRGADHGNERLWQTAGQRAQSRAFTSRHDHCLHAATSSAPV